MERLFSASNRTCSVFFAFYNEMAPQASSQLRSLELLCHVCQGSSTSLSIQDGSHNVYSNGEIIFVHTKYESVATVGFL